MREAMSQPRILIVEDDADWQKIYRRCLGDTDYDITAARKLTTALALLEEQLFDVVITDLKMLGGAEEFSGFGVLEQAKATHPDVQVIVITGYGSADHALRAMGSGAYDYITKDRDLRQKLVLTVQGALEVRALKQELLGREPEDDVELEYDRIVGNSASMQALFEQIASAADSDVNVLICGEESTGKRLIAQTTHRRSPRRRGPFLVVDCGRLSDSVLASELFGHEAGALYSVGEARPGKFERARGGTIFLDSIGDLDVRLQKRLIGAVCDRTVERVGGQRAIRLDARIIASTDKDLRAMLAAEQFERRLFDALNECVISVPPLRERKDGDDIPALAAMFLQRYGQGRPVRFSSDAIALLRHYDYPGNVRELESAVKYTLTVTLGEVIGPEHLRPEIRTYEVSSRERPQREAEAKDPHTIMRVCPLNLGACSKGEEIVRLYSPRRVFANVPYFPEYAECEQAIRRTLERYRLVPVLSKDHLEPTVLLCNVCKLIQTCKYGVTDISMPGSNVLYELGLMHAHGVHCVIVKERRASLSADIQGLLFLEYTHPESLSERLSRWIEDQVKEAEPPVELEAKRRTRLLRVMSERLDEAELRTLCFDLEIEYEDLPGQGKVNKTRELIRHLERRERISDLLEKGEQLRPDIPWHEI
jgi:DNA-binding NtrC family response regulator